MEIGSPEWMEWAKNRQPSPREVYVEDVQDMFEEISGENYWYIIDMENEKEECDFNRGLDIIHDCFEDDSTVVEAAQMLVDFYKAHKYL